MPRAIQIREFGGPEVLEWVDLPLPPPGPGEVQIEHDAIGVNFIDTYHRSGLYPFELPLVPGSEGAGRVIACGADVDGVAVGDRVAYTGLPLGAYAEARNYPADRVVVLPSGLSCETAAAVMLKGLTAWYLVTRSYRVQPGDWVLLYAAAGGVGRLAAQWARSLGGRVIGVVGSDTKKATAVASGCEAVVLADDPDFVGQVRGLSGGGVAAVYDSVGKDTFVQSLDCLAPHGVMVTFGNASGPVEPFAPLELARRGSLYVTRPVLFDFIGTRPELVAAASELFARIEGGELVVDIGQRYALAEAATAQRDLEARRTTGSTLLIP